MESVTSLSLFSFCIIFLTGFCSALFLSISLLSGSCCCLLATLSFQASGLQRFSLPAIRQCLVPELTVWVLTRCALVFLWNETCTISTGTESLKNSLFWRHGVSRALCGFCGWGVTGTEARATEGSSTRAQGLRLGVSKLGSQSQCYAASHMALCLCWRAGEGNYAGQAPLFLQRSLCEQAFLGSALRRENNLPTVCPSALWITVSIISAPELFACLLPKKNTLFSRLYSSKDRDL